MIDVSIDHNGKFIGSFRTEQAPRVGEYIELQPGVFYLVYSVVWTNPGMKVRVDPIRAESKAKLEGLRLSELRSFPAELIELGRG